MQVTALMPIKKESERVVNKNRKLFAGIPLFQVMYNTLLNSESVVEILINTDCEEIMDFFSSKEKVRIIKRPDELKGQSVAANALINYDIKFCNTPHIIQTHCTNPLLTAKTIDTAVGNYFIDMNDHDSLFAVNKIQCRLYEPNLKPLNHHPEKMERTQDMKFIYKENSNFFIFSKESFVNAGNNRIGLKPKVFEMSEIEGIDIDNEEDFLLAELVYLNRNKFKKLF